MEEGHIIVFMTAPDQEDAAGIGRQVVEEGLAACCNIVPALRSIYRWKGTIYDEPEALCIFKTRSVLFEALRSRLKELHGYEVPEIIAVDIKEGHPDYLSWIDENTGKIP